MIADNQDYRLPPTVTRMIVKIQASYIVWWSGSASPSFHSYYTSATKNKGIQRKYIGTKGIIKKV